MALTRGMSAGLLAALAGPFNPVLLVWLDWPGGAVRAHSGAGTIAWDSASWLGVGEFGALDLPAETTGLAAFGATLTLHGVPSEIWDRIDDPIRNRGGRIWFGAVTAPAGNVLVADPVEIFSGYIDAARVTVAEAGKDVEHAVRLTLGAGPSARAASSWHHSAEDQAAQAPGDTAGRHVQHALGYLGKLRWPEN